MNEHKEAKKAAEGLPIPAAPKLPPTSSRPAVEPARERRYRCYGCSVDGSRKLGFDFVGPADRKAVTCPSCGLDANSPHGLQLIVEVAVIHYELPAVEPKVSTVQGRNGVRVRRSHGRDRVACDGPDAASASARQILRSGEAEAVTCPACLGSELMKNLATQSRIDPRFDLPVEPAAGGVLEFRGMPDDAKVTPHDS